MTKEELKSEFASVRSETNAAFDDVLSLFKNYLLGEQGYVGIAELKKNFYDENGGHIIMGHLLPGDNLQKRFLLDNYSVNETFNWLEKKSRVSDGFDHRVEKAYKHAMTVLDNLIEGVKRERDVSLQKAFFKTGSLSESKFHTHKLIGLKIAKLTIESEMREFHIGEEILIEHPEATAKGNPVEKGRSL